MAGRIEKICSFVLLSKNKSANAILTICQSNTLGFHFWVQRYTRTKKHDSRMPCKILYVARFPPYAYFLYTKPSSRAQAVTHHVSSEPSRPIILSHGFG